jgi:hypothetical protein
MARTKDSAALEREFLASLRSAYGDAVSSVIRWGPAAGAKAVDGVLHFLVVMADNSPSELARCAPCVKQWHKSGIATPLFLSADYIRRSLDTFPLEFMDMRRLYRVVDGADVLAELVFDRSDVRAQCEREIKGKLVHLRAEYLAARGHEGPLADLIEASLGAFGLVFSGALYLKGIEIPSDPERLLDAVCDAYGLDRGVFRALEAVARGERRSDPETDRLFDRYVEELSKLSREIDAWA